MSLYIGNQKLGSLYLGSTKIKEAWVGDVKVYGSGDPYNPLGLPPFTIRCKFAQGYTPTMGDSQTLVDSTENVWDITKNSPVWYYQFYGVSELLEVLGANMTGVTTMAGMFQRCTNLTSVQLFDTSSVVAMGVMFDVCIRLTSVPLFDTSKAEYMEEMFFNCVSLTSIPLFDTSSCTNMELMFHYCHQVQSGALALYQQASTQSIPPVQYNDAFKDCGINTPTGLAELQQIPSSWGGLAPG